MASTGFDKLPLKRSKEAPRYDPSSRDAVAEYFEELERLLAREGVTSEEEKKKAALLYVPIDVAKTWKVLQTFTNKGPTDTYEKFRDEVLGFYVGSDSSHVWSRAQLNKLVNDTREKGIHTLEEYSEFYRKFYPMFRYLSTKPRPGIAEDDAAAALLSLVPPEKAAAVSARLANKVPDKHPSDPFSVAEVHEAMTYCLEDQGPFGVLLQGSDHRFRSGAGSSLLGTSAFATQSAQTPAREVKQEPALESFKQEMLSAMTETFRTLFRNENGGQRGFPRDDAPRGGGWQRNDIPRGPPANVRLSNAGLGFAGEDQNCFYCGTAGCHSKTCPAAREDLANGLIERGDGGRIFLPKGTFVPRNLPGTCMRERVLVWHDLNPGKKNPTQVGHMMLVVEPEEDPYYAGAKESESTIEEELAVLMQRAGELKSQLELEKQKRKVRFDGVEITTRPKKHTREESEKDREQPRKRDAPPHLSDRAEAKQRVARDEGPSRDKDDENIPIHPYSKTRPPVTAEPIARDFAFGNHRRANSATDAPSRTEPAYRHTTAIVDPNAEKRVFQRSFGEAQSVTMTPVELLSVSPGIRKMLNDATSSRRFAIRAAREKAAGEDEEDEGDERTKKKGEDKGKGRAYKTFVQDCPEEDEPTVWTHSGDEAETFKLSREKKASQTVEEAESDDEDEELPRGMYRVRRGTFSRDEDEDVGPDIVVGDKTHKLRSIFAHVNNSDVPTECVLDPGSQIVAISEAKCFELKIPYDPSSSLRMVSANGTVDPTLGLARNVAVELGPGVVVYLQMHVVRNASYDVLLGRPFDVLVSGTVVNKPDGRQTITVRCPNSRRELTLPTYARGEGPKQSQTSRAGFRTSMI